MGKNREGNESEHDIKITDEYMAENDRLPDDVHVRHRNRNSAKSDAIKHDSASHKIETPAEETSKTSPEELIGIIPKELFTYLSTYRSGICVSIVIPTHPAGVEVNEQIDVTAFKTSLQQVEKTLNIRRTDQATIKKILQPGYDLLKDEEIWHNMKQGLAVYMAEDFMKFIRLPGAVNREILVNNSFSVMPLVPFDGAATATQAP